MKESTCINTIRALGEAHRIKIIRLLLKGELSVNEISETAAMSQYNVSKHLRVLLDAGLIRRKKKGKQQLYSLAAEFSRRLSGSDERLDLGFCQFDLSTFKD